MTNPGSQPTRLSGPGLTMVVLIILISASMLLKWAPPAEEMGKPTPRVPGLADRLNFDGGVANLTVWAQEHMGYRLPGGNASARLRTYLAATLVSYGWNVTLQPFKSPALDNLTLTNLIARRGPDNGMANATTPLYMLAAHYDTRPYNDQQEHEAAKQVPIPGANDGASGVSVLLELARATGNLRFDHEVWLVFFDGEDHGPLMDKMFLGSANFSDELDQETVDRTKAFVLLDMVGDSDLNIPRESYSNTVLLDEVFSIAEALGEETFHNESGHPVIDDHLELARRDIPAIDLIDFDYGSPGPGGRYWHTTADNRTKVSADSLASVGRVVEAWLRLKATGTDNISLLPESPLPMVQDLSITGSGGGQDSVTIGPGLLVVKDVLIGPDISLTVENATLAITGSLEIGAGASLVLVDSILAASNTADGVLPGSRVVIAEDATVELIRSEWWGPELG